MKRIVSGLLALALVLALALAAPVLAQEAPVADGVVTRRALLIGNNDYEGEENDLHGCVNDMSRMAAALGAAQHEGAVYAKVQAHPNQAGQQILDLIDEAAGGWGIDEDDVTVFFYSGHGASLLYSDEGPNTAIPTPDQAFICGVDFVNVRISSLVSHLSRIPGTVVVLMDNCFSGAVIGKSGGKDPSRAFNQAVINAFAAATAKNTATTPKYQVLTAASGTEVSWEDGTLGANAGLFTSALVKGLGMDYAKNQPTEKMPADKNSDKGITMAEAYAYLLTQVPASEQHVQMYSETPGFDLYARTGAKTLQLNHERVTLSGWGESVALTAAQGGQAVSVTWSSSDPKVAAVGPDGQVVAVGAGKATITARSGKAKAACQVTVNKVEAAAIRAEESLTLNPAEKAQLTVTFEPAGATNRKLKFASSDKRIATVDKAGQVTAVAPGQAAISVKGEKGMTAVCRVTVGEKVPVTGVKLADDTMQLLTGGPDAIISRVSFEPANASNQAFTVTSSNARVASAKAVVKNGVPYVQVTPVAPGTAKLNLRTQDGDHSCQMLVEVMDAVSLDTSQIAKILSGEIKGDQEVMLFIDRVYFKGGGLNVKFILFNNTPRTATSVQNLRLAIYDMNGLEENEYPYTFERLTALALKKKVKLPAKGLLPYQAVSATVAYPRSEIKGHDLARADRSISFRILTLDVADKSGAKLPSGNP